MTIRFLLIEATYTQESVEVSALPLGLAYIASSLRKEFGDTFEFKIVDEDVAEHIKSFQPDVVGISSVTKNYCLAKEYARIAKSNNIPVIIGGVHISLLPQNLTDDMDVGVMYEGEITIVELMKSFLANGRFEKANLYDIKGLVFRDHSGLIVTEPRGFVKHLDSIRYPARDLLGTKEPASMLTSRGCPYRCAFCSTSMFWGNKIRFASARYVAEEIDSIYYYDKAKLITIYDDMFAFDSQRVIAILRELKKTEAFGKVAFHCNTRADLLTDEMAEAMHEMNVKAVGLGVESGSQKVLDYLKTGGITVADNIRAISILKKHHIIPYCSFILGSPQDNAVTLIETIKFIEDNKINYYDFHVLTPYPGTPVWDYAKQRGLVDDDMDWRILNMQGGPSPESLILSEQLSRDEIKVAFRLMENRKRRYMRKASLLAILKNPFAYVFVVFRVILERYRGKVCH